MDRTVLDAWVGMQSTTLEQGYWVEGYWSKQSIVWLSLSLEIHHSLSFPPLFNLHSNDAQAERWGCYR